jgi:hypothetical protein
MADLCKGKNLKGSAKSSVFLEHEQDFPTEDQTTNRRNQSKKTSSDSDSKAKDKSTKKSNEKGKERNRDKEKKKVSEF